MQMCVKYSLVLAVHQKKIADNMLVCLDCPAIIKTPEQYKKKVESLNESRLKTSGTYLGHKIEFLSSPSETTSSKRVKVNTPKKMIAFAPRKIISNTEKQKRTLKGSKKLASSYLVSSRYNRLFSLLLRTSTAAKTAFYSQVKTIVRQEVSTLAFLRLNHLGLTLSTDAVRSAVDRLRMTNDKELIAHKNRISTYINDQAGPRRRLFTDDEGKTLVDKIYKN
ncbi:unnamed protein product [Mytilus edulis]|uniref:Uncharacterized protein n=1 Tax=Mytilus edulis TaxID=6550 RepID=A0A8S3SIN4_MYTED|nr:unnamed protein product [Mytilus edulis]